MIGTDKDNNELLRVVRAELNFLSSIPFETGFNERPVLFGAILGRPAGKQAFDAFTDGFSGTESGQPGAVCRDSCLRFGQIVQRFRITGFSLVRYPRPDFLFAVGDGGLAEIGAAGLDDEAGKSRQCPCRQD